MPFPTRTWSSVRTAYSFLRPYLWASGAFILINENVFTVTRVNGVSMSPTLSPTVDETGQRDKVLWKVWAAKRNVQRGDVVHFMSPTRPEIFAVKRVVALEGDTVVLDPRRRPKKEDDPDPPEARSWDVWKGRVKVPAGHVWVEGDNWRKSSDSNWYGPISLKLITGKAGAVIWPLDRFWTQPWEEWKGRTKVIRGNGVGHWTKEKMPIELSEVGDLGLPKD